MIYATEYIASILKVARDRKGLTQRELAAKAGVPQGHISKIEKGVVDLRISSLVALARVLDLELVLVPRKVVSAVQSIVRSSEGSTPKSGKESHQVLRELNRIQESLASLPKTTSIAREIEQIQRQVRELQYFQLTRPDLDAIRTAVEAVKTFINDTGKLSAVRQSLSQLQRLRNALAHSVTTVSPTDSAQPVYSLDEDDHG